MKVQKYTDKSEKHERRLLRIYYHSWVGFFLMSKRLSVTESFTKLGNKRLNSKGVSLGLFVCFFSKFGNPPNEKNINCTQIQKTTS